MTYNEELQSNNAELEEVLQAVNELPEAGSGTSVQADWNQTDETAADFIKNKPFGETPTGGDTLTWDGNTDGLTSLDLTDSFGLMYYKISSSVPAESDFSDATLDFGGTKIEGSNIVAGSVDGFVIGADATFLVVPNDNFELSTDGATISAPEKGFYSCNVGNAYVRSLVIPGYTDFPYIKTLETKFLPVTTFYGSVPYLYTDKECTIKATKGEVVSALLNNTAVIVGVNNGIIGAVVGVAFAIFSGNYCGVVCVESVSASGTPNYTRLYTAEYTPS